MFSKDLNFPSVAPKLSAASTLILSTECSIRELLDSNCASRPLMPSKTRNRLSAYFFIVLSTAATVAVSTASFSDRAFKSYAGARLREFADCDCHPRMLSSAFPLPTESTIGWKSMLGKTSSLAKYTGGEFCAPWWYPELVFGCSKSKNGSTWEYGFPPEEEDPR